ncbi:hypothetical protein LOTGIDRAFT_229119 [Lottia gigantea]|uniref:Membrane insertase YidC/Oxa/ALB C-terminal domain-containing protein n=1 Tax=Lottia gigantea TaxID=225164 RepID=V3ZXT8_LOTGI|nr:hypothetical protein LOTGIDRAFT_229119 [Lottia gigantea]ESO89227.1 hypothetical protein LOTGIDRAFT_229119 [Lottia gigantea]
MNRSCRMFCHLRVGVYKINCRSFGVISQASLDSNRNNGHGFAFLHIQQNQTSKRGIHMVGKTPLFLINNKTNLSNLKPQIRRASFMENYIEIVSNNAVVKGCEDCLLYLHNLTGLPWWIDIVLTACILNLTFRLPLTICTMKQKVKLRTVYEKLMSSMPQMTKKYKMEVFKKKLGLLEAKKLMVNIYQEKERELFIEHNCHPRKVTVAELSTIPLLLGVSIAFRNLSGNSVSSLFSASIAKSPELMTEGILWFPNLAIPDPYFILPMLLGVQSLRRDYVLRSTAPKGNNTSVWIKYFMTGCSVLFMFIATVCPTCMVLYWICNGFFSNMIRLGCNLPQVKKFFKVDIPLQPLKTNPSIARYVKALNERKK